MVTKAQAEADTGFSMGGGGKECQDERSLGGGKPQNVRWIITNHKMN